MGPENAQRNAVPFTFIDQSAAAEGSASQRRSLIQRHIAVQTRIQKRRQEKQDAKKDSSSSESQQLPHRPGRQRSADRHSRTPEEDSDTASGRRTSGRGSVYYSPGASPFNQSLRAEGKDSLGSLAIPSGSPRDLELMDYLTNVIWAGFSRLDSGSVYNPFAARWLPRCFGNPALKHALLMASSVHLEARLLTKNQDQNVIAEQLFHQNEAIRYFRSQLQNIDQADIDDMLMIIVCLATNQCRRPDSDVIDATPFTPPLRSGNWLNIYGMWDFSDLHWNALLDLVKNAGGVTRIKEYGIPWLIAYADLLQSMTFVRKPKFPLVSPGGNRVPFERVESFLGPPHIYDIKRKLGQGFEYLTNLGCNNDIVQTFRDLADFSATLYAYHDGMLHDASVSRVSDTRNEITHRILCLPVLDDVEDENELYEDESTSAGDMKLYEVCRLTALLYSAMVTFPLPRSRHARGNLIPAIRRALEQIEPYDNDPAVSRIYLWCAVLAGVSAYDNPHQEWFRDQVASLSMHLKIRSWEGAEEILETFAWLSCACSNAGSKLWNSAVNGGMI